ncbi:MAG: S1 RNA-binding domain-containing protein [Lachnospiraceae bacterium]|jgi:small subunit ribosomal protein S1
METMRDFESVINSSMREMHQGDLIEGTVIGVSDTEAVVDLQYYAEGIIKTEDFSDDPSFNIKQDVEIGSTVKAIILRMDDGSGNILLSVKKANDILIWEELEALQESGEHFCVKVSESVKGGVIAYYKGKRAFIPASKLALTFVEDTESYVGQILEVIVITADESENRLVLSARDVLRQKAEEEKSRMISNLAVGFATEGTVESLMPYGAFVNIGNGISGLVHISQITGIKRLRHPKEMLTVGDKVKVKVTDIKDGKISLSMKALEESSQSVEKLEEETVEIPESEELSTSLGDLLKGFRFD